MDEQFSSSPGLCLDFIDRMHPKQLFPSFVPYPPTFFIGVFAGIQIKNHSLGEKDSAA